MRACTAGLGLLLLATALPAQAEETVRRQVVDAGVHIPVLTKAPQLVEFVQADYPAEALQSGLTAEVRLQVTIQADGAVGEVEIPTPVGHGFDEAATAAVKRFRFTPAEVDDTPAPVRIEYVYHFTLQAQVDGGGSGEVGVLPADAGVPGARLQGTLIARGSRKRIPGALVGCDNWPGSEVSSDEQGRFRLEVPAGACQVRAAAADFQVFQTVEQLEPTEEKEVNYFLRPQVAGYQTVVKDTKEKTEVVRRTVSREELQKVPGSFGDPVRVIQDFPGVARAPFILGQLIVRGANPAQTLTYFDGVEIPILFHLGGGPSVVNGEFIDRVDFLPGGFGARYGRAVGGVVDVASRQGASDTWHGSAKVDVQDTALFFEAPIADGVSLAAGARRSYIDAIIPLFLPKDPQGGSLLVLPVYWDYQVRLDVGGKKGQRLEGGSRFSVFAFGSDDNLQVVASGGQRNTDVAVNAHTLFHRVVGSWEYKHQDTTFKLTPYLGYDLVSLSFGTTTLNADRWTAGLRADLGVEVAPWLSVRTGADIFQELLVGSATVPVISGNQYVAFPGANPATTTQSISQTLATLDGALFAEADFKLGPVTITPGLRASHAYIDDQVRDAWDPRLWVSWKVIDGTTVKGSVGLYTQPPPATSLVPPPFGTPSLGYERAFQSSLGVAQRITELINVDVTGFFNRRYDNLVSPGTTTVNPDGTVTRTTQANLGLGRAYGVEVLLRHEVSKYFFGWIAYTLSRSEQRRAGTSDPYVLTQFDQTHILTAVGSLRLPLGFELGVRFRYVTGNPSNPLIHDADLYRADNDTYQSTFGATRSARLAPFHQLDVRIDKNFYFPEWTLDLYVDVQNVYNQQNVEATIYDYRFRRAYDVPGIPILPVLGVKASF